MQDFQILGGYCPICGNSEKGCSCPKLNSEQKPSMTQNPMLGEVPPKLNEVNWLMLSEAKSECGKFKVIHHSTSSFIQLRIGEDEVVPTDVWFDYAEWESFLKMIRDIS